MDCVTSVDHIARCSSHSNHFPDRNITTLPPFPVNNLPLRSCQTESSTDESQQHPHYMEELLLEVERHNSADVTDGNYKGQSLSASGGSMHLPTT